MACLFLIGSSLHSCAARRGTYLPSIGELKELCNPASGNCPALLAAQAGDPAETAQASWPPSGYRQQDRTRRAGGHGTTHENNARRTII
ncbi:MAG: hypothetical protein A2010_13590 [Nitrospirae bacterium GWD2_57_9]|nr:MAG: hypothetical protein A2010_13590 [Nitrospirae bacterium GWD2_57_9]